MRTFCIMLLSTFLCTGVSAQETSVGFRAGLNFITHSGPLEGNGDLVYEDKSRTTGFHVGATVALEFTDLVGVKADIMYTQKGGKYTFNGPSTFYIYEDAEDTGLAFATTKASEIGVVNSYIDLPITAYYKFGKFEIEGGLSAGFLINSRVTGGVTHTGVNGLPVTEITYSIDGNYFSDEVGFLGIEDVNEDIVGSSGEPIPQTIGAYYDNLRDEKLYKRLDFGLVGGLAYYLNNGLYLGARYQFGLTDVTRGENDQRIARNTETLGEREFNTEDKDYTRSIQASIGFRF